MREFLGTVPSNSVRFGTIAVIITFIALLIITAIIQYNDVVTGRILITSQNPIANIKAANTGIVEEIFVKNGDSVSRGDHLAVIRTPAKYEDVLFVKNSLETIENNYNIRLDSLGIKFPAQLSLGTLQEDYLKFYLQYQNVILTDSIRPLEVEESNMANQIDLQKDFVSTKKNQLVQVGRQLTISRDNLERSKKLLSKGVISQKDYDESRNRYYQTQESYQALKSEISSYEIELSKLQSDFTGIELQKIKSTSSYREIFDQSVESLKSKILDWEKTNVFESPISGRVSLFKVWNRYQNVKVDETVFAVVPFEIESMVGHVQVPVRNSGKITTGQDVIIKLDTYPFEQYGYINGRVEGISSIPDQQSMEYSVFVSIDSLTTNYGKSLPFNQEMIGSAQIVTERLSLLERLLYAARKLFERG